MKGDVRMHALKVLRYHVDTLIFFLSLHNHHRFYYSISVMQTATTPASVAEQASTIVTMLPARCALMFVECIMNIRICVYGLLYMCSMSVCE